MDLRATLMGLTFVVIWSSAFTSARIIVASAPPLTALGLRFLLSGGAAVLIALWLGQSWRLTPAQWRATVIFGICQNVLYLGLNFVAMQWVEASVAVIIASMLPLTVAFAGWAVYGERLRPLASLGLAAGVIGVLLIMGARVDEGLDPVGVLLCIGGLLALTFATLSVRQAISGGNIMMIVGLQMLTGAGVLLTVGLLTEPFEVTPSWPLFFAFTYTLLFPGLVATLLWFFLVQRVGATEAAIFHFLNPFVGVMIAWVVLAEPLGPLDLVGVAVITFGILAVQLSRRLTRM